ncbi:MAG: 16S rRNA (cytosine(1402)-N(4))-methyltransferase RsmH [Desulfuromonadales bacterium]|nr:16S rRNA (cytosine(1402)-N(4))-methyltransferase RsmH [Desulfuromonadales bacterium]MDT8423376.1 16S rRNA (cytosine(1402)-N(4))-methyltransferase RsmH [Desulfuromonadales bacterium]
MGATFRHVAVLQQEVINWLQPRPGGIYLDATLGGGGHARLILEQSFPDGRLLGLDRDPAALAAATAELEPFGERVTTVHGNFAQVQELAAQHGFDQFDGILLDLGVSSHQLDTVARGFSFQGDAPLDMRMDTSGGRTAADLVAELSAQELTRIFFEYGEERWARRISRRIVETRTEHPLNTTRALAELVAEVVPKSADTIRINPATRVFQALRIEVNGELDALRQGLAAVVPLLHSGGRLAVISFHSLEDRIVKHFMRDQALSCECPPRLPVCSCNRQATLKILTRKGVRAAAVEVANNPRSRSAMLRVAEKI